MPRKEHNDNNKHVYLHHVNMDKGGSHNQENSGLILTAITGAKNIIVRIFSKLFQKTFETNQTSAGRYINRGENIMKFPLLVTESIDYPVVAKFCSYLQKERAENFRTFFFNKDVYLGFDKSQMAKEFGSNFYESVDNTLKNEKEMDKEQDLRKIQHKQNQLSINSKSNKPQYDDSLNIKGKDLMPIAPTMINIAATDAVNKSQIFQILGIRYLPHMIPFYEMKVAFKYGILNNRSILRFIKLLSGDLTFLDFFTNTDRNAVNSMLTKIAFNEKSWNTNLKKSSQAVSIVITLDEFNDLCENVVDLRDPNKFKHVQKDIGFLDLMILDKASKELIRINAADNYIPVTHDLRDVLNSNEKDIVIQARIDASKMRSEV